MSMRELSGPALEIRKTGKLADPCQVWLIARTVLIEAIRRKEIYAIVLISILIIGAVMMVNFFELRGLSKFYAEIALDVMSAATALTVSMLAVRQLPREFETRTIHTLLAKPVGRATFLIGKSVGVLFAAAFCLMLFMAVYAGGSLYIEARVHWGLLAQFIYLQLIGFAILAAVGMWLSLLMNTDAALTLTAMLYFTSNVLSSATNYLYHLPETSGLVRGILKVLTFVLPQFFLFDLSEKTIHGDKWPPLKLVTILELSAYGIFFVIVFGGFALIAFRRRSL